LLWQKCGRDRPRPLRCRHFGPQRSPTCGPACGPASERARRHPMRSVAGTCRTGGMAARDGQVTVQVDAEMVERARAQLGLGGGSDAAVVERAMNAYLLGRLLDVTQARGLRPRSSPVAAGGRPWVPSRGRVERARAELGLGGGRRGRQRLLRRQHSTPSPAPARGEEQECRVAAPGGAAAGFGWSGFVTCGRRAP